MRHYAHSLVALALTLAGGCTGSGGDEVFGPGPTNASAGLETETETETDSDSETGESETDNIGPTSGSDGSSSESDSDDSETSLTPTGDPDGLCEIGEYHAPDVTPEIMLVLDRSSSMVSATYESYGPENIVPDINKWTELHGQVWELIARMDGATHVGMQLFPEQLDNPPPDAVCDVSSEPTIPLGFGNAEALMEALPPADALEFKGASPAGAAIASAADHLLASENPGPKAIVLVTDGAANCGEGTEEDPVTDFDDELSKQLSQLYKIHDVPTYVVGIAPEVEAQKLPLVSTYSSLSELALAGGVTKSPFEGFYRA
ncbi:MAG: hypothetical protein ACPG77_01010, partial [Nannocystaceae bacterium]